MWDREKMLVTSPFFSQYFFYHIEEKSHNISHIHSSKKILWKSEKVLVTRIFSFFFDILLLITQSSNLNLSQTSPGFNVSALQVF